MEQAEVGQSPTLLALRFATGVWSIPKVYFAALALSGAAKKVYSTVYPMPDRTWPTLAGQKAFVNNYSAKNHARPFSTCL